MEEDDDDDSAKASGTRVWRRLPNHDNWLAAWRSNASRLYFDMDATERIQAASQFLLQSPPGEINDVLNGMVKFL